MQIVRWYKTSYPHGHNYGVNYRSYQFLFLHPGQAIQWQGRQEKRDRISFPFLYLRKIPRIIEMCEKCMVETKIKNLLFFLKKSTASTCLHDLGGGVCAETNILKNPKKTNKQKTMKNFRRLLYTMIYHRIHVIDTKQGQSFH